MQIIQDIISIRKILQSIRSQNKKIAFVPTMGNLHDGHLELVRSARALADYIVVSVFVNPLQFAPHEDFANYPRTLEEDAKKLAVLETDLLFTPFEMEIYPLGKENHIKIDIPDLSDEFCGKSRPGFFQGVATVIMKLFNIVMPDQAIFGEKDYQQLLVIKKLVFDLQMPIEIHSIPTVRDKDNLALSSRNVYLSAQERMLAPQLYAILKLICDQIKQGARNFLKLEQEAKNTLITAGFKLDYFAIRRLQDLKQPTLDDCKLIILAAVFLNKTRLIDNIQVLLKNKKSL